MKLLLVCAYVGDVYENDMEILGVFSSVEKAEEVKAKAENSGDYFAVELKDYELNKEAQPSWLE